MNIGAADSTELPGRHKGLSFRIMGFRLDYFSCILTVLSTVLVGRRMWQGWIVASANSAVICVIAFRTAQIGFVPANLFCLAIYGYNIAKWRSH